MSRITMKRWSGGWYSRTWLMELPKNSLDNGQFVVRAAKDDEQQHLTIEVVGQPKWDRFGEPVKSEDILEWFATRTFEEPNIFKAQVIAISDSEGYIDRFAVEGHIRAVIAEWVRVHRDDGEPEYCPSLRWTEEQRREARSSVPSCDRALCDE